MFWVFLQVCHIVLGLRPATPGEEGQIIKYKFNLYFIASCMFRICEGFSVDLCLCVCLCRGWLERESRHGLQQSQNWFLISMLWWQQWKDYVKYVSKAEECERLQ